MTEDTPDPYVDDPKWQQKKRRWNQYTGNYSLPIKSEVLNEKLQYMNDNHMIGTAVCEIGSSRHPISTCIRRRPYNTYEGLPDRKMIYIDLMAEFEKKDGNNLFLKFDIEEMIRDSSASARAALQKIADFLELEDELTGDLGQINTFILSDILNYIDFRRVIPKLAHYVSPAGYLIFYNQPGRGPSAMEGAPVHSERGLKKNSDLIRVLRKCNMNIESIYTAGNKWISVDELLQRNEDSLGIVLIAKKPISEEQLWRDVG